MKYIILFFFITSILFSFSALAQEHPNAAAASGKFKPVHSLGIAIGHAQVFEGRDAEGNKQVLSLPFWGIDYNLQLSHKWIIALHTDIITETFKVEKHLDNGEETEVVERTKPIAPAILGIYKPNDHWGMGLGVGGEFAKEENYFLMRAGVEYGTEIRNGWEVFGGITYDFRWNAYDTWTIGLGISKSLGKEKK